MLTAKHSTWKFVLCVWSSVDMMNDSRICFNNNNPRRKKTKMDTGISLPGFIFYPSHFVFLPIKDLPVYSYESLHNILYNSDRIPQRCYHN